MLCLSGWEDRKWEYQNKVEGWVEGVEVEGGKGGVFCGDWVIKELTQTMRTKMYSVHPLMRNSRIILRISPVILVVEESSLLEVKNVYTY